MQVTQNLWISGRQYTQNARGFMVLYVLFQLHNLYASILRNFMTIDWCGCQVDKPH
jgi:hypothetical protein